MNEEKQYALSEVERDDAKRAVAACAICFCLICALIGWCLEWSTLLWQ